MSSNKKSNRQGYLNLPRIKMIDAINRGVEQAKDPSYKSEDTSDLEWKCKKCDYKGKGVTNALEHRKYCKIIKGGKKKTKKRKTKRKKTKRKSYKKKH